MLKKTLAISALVVSILACMSSAPQSTPQEQPGVTQVVITQVVITQISELSAPAEIQPTYTFYPTYTPNPIPEPQTIFVTPTLLPDWQLMQTFTGDGKWTSDLFALPAGLVRIKWNFTGDGNFAFYINDMNSDFSENLENAIDNIDGQRVLKLDASDRYVIDVVLADGNWQITVEFMP